MQVARGALAALALLTCGACVHEVKRTPAPSLLPPGKVAVVGEVGRAGLVDFRAGMTALEALRAAGGLTPLAQPDAAMLTRSVSGLVASTSLHLDAMAEGREPDVPLEEGDLIQVPGPEAAPRPRPRPAIPPELLEEPPADATGAAPPRAPDEPPPGPP